MGIRGTLQWFYAGSLPALLDTTGGYQRDSTVILHGESTCSASYYRWVSEGLHSDSTRGVYLLCLILQVGIRGTLQWFYAGSLPALLDTTGGYQRDSTVILRGESTCSVWYYRWVSEWLYSDSTRGSLPALFDTTGGYQRDYTVILRGESTCSVWYYRWVSEGLYSDSTRGVYMLCLILQVGIRGTLQWFYAGSLPPLFDTTGGYQRDSTVTLRSVWYYKWVSEGLYSDSTRGVYLLCLILQVGIRVPIKMSSYLL
jgi:hypothetical protein